MRPGEIGTVAEIEAAARSRGLSCRKIDLDAQFRCGGSRVYEMWVQRLLGLVPGGPVPWDGDENFWLTTIERPSAMEDRLRGLLKGGYGARIAAGYCWHWSEPITGGGLVADVSIGEWHRPCNNKKPSSHAGAPGTPFWGKRPCRLRAGRLCVHGPGLRVRLLRRDHGS